VPWNTSINGYTVPFYHLATFAVFGEVNNNGKSKIQRRYNNTHNNLFVEFGKKKQLSPVHTGDYSRRIWRQSPLLATVVEFGDY